ncbi:MbcA/ParS/Xre antitoxin family protein [Curvibacter delicatus]|jgi:uncharacterized protein (DUF2384 family)|uniref:MbcA/ParS/Xre antitoxin family protein n=1 Tax=Curvibacter delicatus TaxID=80879 RepID=UPI00083436A6|nr:MbcA/ParS/Xre antitoxin family protein [Curvibacter delicatus]
MSDKLTRKEMAIDALVTQVQKMVEESGDATGFDAREWLLKWLDRPLPALGGQRPVELLSSEDGLEVLTTLLARAQAGAFT